MTRSAGGSKSHKANRKSETRAAGPGGSPSGGEPARGIVQQPSRQPLPKRPRKGVVVALRTEGASRQCWMSSRVSAVRSGRPLYYLPDQDAGRRHSVFAPFFGIPAATFTALARLALDGNDNAFAFPRPMLTRPGFAFSVCTPCGVSVVNIR